MIVENKPAAAGMLATRDVLSQPADGYNAAVLHAFRIDQHAVYKNPGFKLADLAPISLVAKYYYGIALSNSIPAEDFEQFVQYAKAHPGEVTYATIGAGSAQEIMARQLEKIAGISMNRIPFRGGPQVVQEMIAGRVNFYASPTIAVVPQYQREAAQAAGDHQPDGSRDAGGADLEGKRHRLCAVRLARHLRGERHAAADPRPAQQGDRLDRGDAGIPGMIEKGGSLPEASTPAQLGQVITQTVTDVEGTIREFGMQQE